MLEHNLKKQSQFVTPQIGVSSYIEGYYENKPAWGVQKNKAKQSQFHTPELTKGVGKREKSLAAANLLTG
ncbi:MAG: hypothetical protein ACYTFW_07065 [Planctomycetota bacterium]|jgi:hypothetical protein